ncbi:MgtC/SapB family protein [Lapidilactobacillus achengensis]|uniref:MgtC/SapB family protein n=1 Tax=Lapidilactobacillus achengensis TaxID=2486000 RepID=A0ABW1URL7_9LACO|nr:MgtC/SapB family protein [Lapidilactobacillus achengensis]
MILKLSVTTVEILIRLLAAVVISGLIGYDREQKNHPAGIRTHILVCVGACVIAMIQQEIGFEALAFAKAQPQFAGVIRADEARLIAQVVSGIGFLGAGTIVVTHRAVTGLTTAASLWATAGLGLAVGMGYYRIAGISALVVLAVLALLKKVIVVHPAFKRVEIQYTEKTATREQLQAYFADKKIKIERVSFKVSRLDSGVVYTNVYAIDLPHEMSYVQLVDDLSAFDHMQQVRLVNV